MYIYEYPFVSPEEALDPDGLVGKASRLVEQENRNALLDSGIVCRFSRGIVNSERLEAFFEADYTELLAIGARIVDLERHFNNQRGLNREDDTLPYDLPGFESALNTYYRVRGWAKDGTVPPEKVEAASRYS